jgi:hypothetical protein
MVSDLREEMVRSGEEYFTQGKGSPVETTTFLRPQSRLAVYPGKANNWY